MSYILVSVEQEFCEIIGWQEEVENYVHNWNFDIPLMKGDYDANWLVSATAWCP